MKCPNVSSKLSNLLSLRRFIVAFSIPLLIGSLSENESQATLSVPASLSCNALDPASGTQITYVPPSGVLYTSVLVSMGSSFQSDYICDGATIFGLTGSQGCVTSGSSVLINSNKNIQSNAPRTLGTPQLTAYAEANKYSGVPFSSLPSKYSYRDVPNINLDDDGQSGVNILFQSRPTSDCGLSGSIASRIASCNLV